ncbi:hypothetical protein [Chryseobacterium sp. JJR-5R]
MFRTTLSSLCFPIFTRTLKEKNWYCRQCRKRVSEDLPRKG